MMQKVTLVITFLFMSLYGQAQVISIETEKKILEGDTQSGLFLLLDKPSTKPIRLRYKLKGITANLNNDIDSPKTGEITISPGSKLNRIPVTANDDSIFESTEEEVQIELEILEADSQVTLKDKKTSIFIVEDDTAYFISMNSTFKVIEDEEEDAESVTSGEHRLYWLNAEKSRIGMIEGMVLNYTPAYPLPYQDGLVLIEGDYEDLDLALYLDFDIIPQMTGFGGLWWSGFATTHQHDFDPTRGWLVDGFTPIDITEGTGYFRHYTSQVADGGTWLVEDTMIKIICDANIGPCDDILL